MPFVGNASTTLQVVVQERLMIFVPPHARMLCSLTCVFPVADGAMSVFMKERNNVDLFDGVVDTLKLLRWVDSNI